MGIDIVKAWDIFVKNAPLFGYGVVITILYAIVGTVFGLLIGLILGGLRTVEIEINDTELTKFLKRIGILFTQFYIWVLRGTPMMVQALFFYYLLKPLIGWNGLEAGLVIISINTGAYMAEIIRSGIQSVDNGQKEAGRSLGLNNIQVLIFVILPQAIKKSFPSIGNQLIVNIKDSSMLNVLSVTELFFQTSSIAGSNFKYIETYFISAIIYLILTSFATWILNAIEHRLNKTSNASSMDFCS